MTPNVAAFIEWWEGLAPDQRREQIVRARERKTYWMVRRSRMLFGLLKDDSIFGTEDYNDPLNDGDRDGGELEDADEDALNRWAERYDELDGAPENEDDR